MAGSERVHIDPHIGVRTAHADYVARHDASTRISSKREREPDRPEVKFPDFPLRRTVPPPVNDDYYSLFSNSFHI